MKKTALFSLLLFTTIFAQAQYDDHRLDSLYCYNYNSGNEDFDLAKKIYYTYLDEDDDLVLEYLEQTHLSIGNWRNEVRRLYQYDENGQVIETIQQRYQETEAALVNDLKTTFSYDSELKMSSEIHYRWNEIEEIWKLDNKRIYTYENNVLLYVLIQKYDADSETWLDRFQELYTYDPEQNLVAKTTEIWIENNWQNYTKLEYVDWIDAFHTKEINQFWDDHNQTWTNENQILFNYDSDLLVNQIHQNWNQDIQSWDNVLQTNFYYNSEQALSSTFSQDWKIVDYNYQSLSKTIRSFSGTQLTEERLQNWQVHTQSWLDAERSIFSYNDNVAISEHLVESWDTLEQVWTPVNRYLHQYDSQNHLSQIIKQQPVGEQFVDIIRRDYEYDILGKLLKETVFFYQNGWILYAEDTYEYNALEQLEYQTDFFINFSTNTLIPNNRDVYFYNENGQRIEHVEEWWNTNSETWENNIRELSTYDGNGKLKRSLRQSWNFMEEWEDGHQTLYAYDENTNLTAISIERNQEEDWFLLEKTTYQNDINGRANSAIYQVFEDEQYQYFKWLYAYDEGGNLTLEEFQKQTSPVYDWVNDQQCDYFRSLTTSLAEVVVPSVSCVFPNPYRGGTWGECSDLEVYKKHQVLVYQLNGQLLYQQSFTGQTFVIDVKWEEGLYIIGIFEEGKVVYAERVWMSS